MISENCIFCRINIFIERGPRYFNQYYLKAETLIKANATLVDYQSTLLLAQRWGGGEVASADGIRFIAPVRMVHASPNRKYFGSSRGSPGTTSFQISMPDFIMFGSLTLGKIRASVATCSLLSSDRPFSLTQAVIEAGKINKTLSMLNYIDDEDYRRRILTQLNRGKSRHAIARAR